MTPEQITLVQESFAKVAPIADKAAELFYGRLFEIAPEVKPLFKGDMSEQGMKLMAALTMITKSLTDLDALVPAAQTMAVRHVEYGVTADQYKPVGEALIWTLGQGLGDDFTDEVKEAWITAYTVLSGVMIDAAYKSEVA